MKTLIFLIFFGLLSSSQILAVEHRDLMRELDFEFKLTSLALEVGDELTRELKAKNAIDPNTHEVVLSQQELIDTLQKKAMDYARAYEEFYAIKYEGNYKKGAFTELMNKVNWREVFFATKDVLKNSTSILKLYGVGYILAFIAGSVVEYSSYFFMAMLDMKLLLSVALFIPYGKTLLLLPVKYHEFVHRKRMQKLLGSKAKYNAFLAHRKELKEKLRLTSPKKFLFPLIEDLEEQSLKVATLSRESIPGKLLTGARRAMGFEVKGLDFHNLKIFMQKHDLNDATFDYVRLSPLPNYLKTGLISQMIIESSPSPIRAAFLAEFNDYLVDLVPTGNKGPAKEWIKELLDKPSVEKIRRLMANLPPGVDPKMAALSWEKFILPHYSREFNVGYLKYRRLLKEILLFKDQVLARESMDQKEFFELFDSHLSKALKLNLNQCTEPEESILRVLLKATP